MADTKSFVQQDAESEAMLTARDQAMQTPDQVRKAFLARRRECGPVYVEPFSLGVLLLFEEIQHPFHTGGKPLLDDDGQPLRDDQGRPRTLPVTLREAARAIFIFHDSEAAADELSGGLDAFDAAAMSLARAIDPALLPEITARVTQTFTEGLATIPGGGASNPSATGS